MRWRQTFIAEVSQALQQLGLRACPVCGSAEGLGIGRFPAFWSPTDDRDDQGIKIAGVFGDLHQPRPSAAFRLAVNGCYRALQHPWQQAQTADDPVDSRRGWSILKRLLARGSTWST